MKKKTLTPTMNKVSKLFVVICLVYKAVKRGRVDPKVIALKTGEGLW